MTQIARLFAPAPAVALVLAALTACTMPPLPPPSTQPSLPDAARDACGASAYARLTGQPATALERELIMRQVRVIRPGMAVTMDFRPDRLNFEIGANGRIARVYCG